MYANTIPMRFPRITLPGGEVVEKPHPEWAAWHVKWGWYVDSYEGGDPYRYNTYGADDAGRPRRNLYRHRREEPELGEDGRVCGGDDYSMRLERTPIPTFVQEAVDKPIGKIYSQEIKREGPDVLEAWWRDVDGRGTSIDQFMSEQVAPLLSTLGNLDAICDRPPTPKGEDVKTRADELRLKLDRCIASYALPQNVVWWKLGDDGEYAEAIVREIGDKTTYVYWNAEVWKRYDADGKAIEGAEGKSYGVVPMFRGFDGPKRPRYRHVGMPRFEAVAELQREYYNRDAELVLSDTYQAFPLLQGPEEYVKKDGSVEVGPNRLLPMKRSGNGPSWSYQGFSVVDFPTGGADSLRKNKDDLRDAADRVACLAKPAGATGGDVTGQSGISKRIDQDEGHQQLSDIAASLQRFEERLAKLAYLVITGKPAGPDVAIKVKYPRRFDLFTLEQRLDGSERFQGLLATAGNCPEVEGPQLKQLAREIMPGEDDETYAEWDDAIDAYLSKRSQADAEDQAADAEALLQRLADAGSTVNTTKRGAAPGGVPDPNASDGVPA